MTARLTAPLALIALTTMALAARSGAQVPEDRKLLEGTWMVASAENGGVPVPARELVEQSLVFAADGTYRVVAEGEEMETGTFTLDAKATPRSIDLRLKTGQDAGKTQLGVYQFDDEDTLAISFNPPGDRTRPKSLKTPKGSPQFTFRMKRKAGTTE